MNKFLSLSRYMIIVAVLGSLVASITLLVYGGLETVALVADAIASGKVSGKGAKLLSLSFIELVDLFLLSTVFLIVALGLYELFIDDGLQLPKWLEIHTLDDLKAKLIGVVIVVLAVLFLGQVVSWDGQRDLMQLGAGIAMVIAALTYFLSAKVKNKPNGSKLEKEE